MKMKPGVRIAIAVGIAVAIFGGRQVFKHDASAPAGAASTQAPAKPVHVEVKPQVWKRGRLTFKPCELTRPGSGRRAAAWCSPFRVPENRADPHSRKIGLKLAIVRSAATVPDPDMVVFLAGGPGQAATREYVMAAKGFEELHKHHDILLLDQRGTGDSNPLTCAQTEKDADPNIDYSQDPDARAAYLKKCLAEVEKKADPRYYTTTDAVADLEAVRQALGAPKFDLLGVSYGTRMAQQYAMRHPDAVRSMVLDSAVPNTVALGQLIAQHLQDALRKDFALCTANAACKKRYGDPYRTLQKLVADVRAHPHMVTVRDPRTYKPSQRMFNQKSLATVVRLFAYSPETIALLPLSIDAAAHGDPGPLMGQERLVSGDLGSDINSGMGLSVTCAEDADLIHPRPQDKDTLLGDGFVRELKANCAIWPHGTRPADFHQPLRGKIPTLVLSGQLDPVTPPAWGKQIVTDLDNARQLVLKGQGHSEFMRGCMPKVIRRFIDQPDPKTLDAKCLDRLGPTPPYVNFNGATP
ncbi:alpha/beta hydrolase [Oleiagrimonas citrea]